MGKYVEFLDVSKKFGEALILDTINFSIDKGEFIVVLGPSGSGKSTLLEILCGFEKETSGDIKLDGEFLGNKPSKDRNISMVFQSYALMPHLSVFDNVAFGMKIRKESKSLIEEKVSVALKILELTEHKNKKPKELSGGQRQRVAIARAIVREPKIFLMDEPLSNLDYKLRMSSAREIVSLNKKLNATTIYVTHDEEEALTMANRIVILDKGKIQQIGTPKDIYINPKSIFVAEFIGKPKINIFTAKLNNKALYFGFSFKLNLDDKFKDLKDDDYYIGIRPENIKIDENGDIEGIIKSIEYIAGEYILEIEVKSTILKLKTYENERYNIEDKISFDIDLNKINIFDKKTKMNMGEN
ncbi:ABC transporter ATP-binding protein [uncultured Clostridium sp.]|uniref:ABC transporter ATP-binding protein n=1 Tax=uncultured Clostridium sp. TaxID=59620 RepID=UPI002633445A|nr:ABC transporter ATP-binding protein [uncultured Clostridium sp.]